MIFPPFSAVLWQLIHNNFQFCSSNHLIYLIGYPKCFEFLPELSLSWDFLMNLNDSTNWLDCNHKYLNFSAKIWQLQFFFIKTKSNLRLRVTFTFFMLTSIYPKLKRGPLKNVRYQACSNTVYQNHKIIKWPKIWGLLCTKTKICCNNHSSKRYGRDSLNSSGTNRRLMTHKWLTSWVIMNSLS